MKNNNKIIYLSAIFLLITVTVVCGTIRIISASADGPISRKIVVFRKGVLNEPAKEALLSKLGGVKVKHLNLINGTVAYLSPKTEGDLRHNSNILRIDDDVIVEALVRGDKDDRNININVKPLAIQPAEKLPWGIDRIDAEKIWNIATADPIKVAVIDTGIDIKHPDLLANIKGGANTINSRIGYNDDNGHGTHVAGIIGAIDNTIGVVGVGPKIDIYAIKALDRNGSGYISDVIEGIDWAIKNKIQVINMSLGTTADIQSFHNAVTRANQAGIVQVAAAGNSGGTVIYPAAYLEVIAVSATDNTDTIASWSSRGSEVDLAAPGVNIYSTYKGQSYATLSGTSMASPHVAGVAALVLSTPSKCDFDTNGICTPDEVQQRLQATAKDLGTAGKDNLYGYGLVNAEKAVIQ